MSFVGETVLEQAGSVVRSAANLLSEQIAQQLHRYRWWIIALYVLVAASAIFALLTWMQMRHLTARLDEMQPYVVVQ